VCGLNKILYLFTDEEVEPEPPSHTLLPVSKVSSFVYISKTKRSVRNECSSCCDIYVLQVRPIPGQGPGPVETINTETIGLPGPRVSAVPRYDRRKWRTVQK
jgi:hypothetical protein